MKALIVNCFDTHEDRIDLVHGFLKDKGYDVTVIQSDFRHLSKVRRKDEKEDFVFIKARPYYKNISVARMISHYIYALDAFKIVDNTEYDLMYVVLPPNTFAKFAARRKRRKKDFKLIFDLIDLWPESLPVKKSYIFPPLIMWRRLRNKNLASADYLITECNLYREVLGDAIKGVKTETAYIVKKENNVISSPDLSDEVIHLAYLGSINNIIDIDKIQDIMKAIIKYKPVTLQIIGDGEKRTELIDSAKAAGAKVEYHSKVYNPQEKQDIFDNCHFGLNVMKENVCVGLTTKSIDYFQNSLPIINNIKADTKEIVDEYGVGFNLDSIELDDLAKRICEMDKDDFVALRDKAHNVYKSKFTEKSFKNLLNNFLDKV